MPVSPERDSIIASIKPLVDAFAPRLVAVYLYGSRATGESTVESDYDFAVIAERPMTIPETASLRGAIIDALPGNPDVDCVDMRRIPLTLAAQVLEHGILLDCGDDPERARIETRLLSMYAGLNEERAGIVGDIALRGSVYAR